MQDAQEGCFGKNGDLVEEVEGVAGVFGGGEKAYAEAALD